MTPSPPERQSVTTHCSNNELPFAVVEDANAKQSMCSFSIKAGHFFDPHLCHGLAHLLEHLLFMGCESHPEPNGIMDYIQKRGGSVNAWTAGEFANFHFSCSPQHFTEACRAMVSALTTPFLAEQAIEKEIQAIDAEFKFKRNDELRRLYQIHKETSNQAHPFSQFSVGNQDIFSQFSTLKLKQMLSEFHQTLYVASNMRIALCVPSMSAALKLELLDIFDLIPPGPAAKLTLPPLYLKQHLALQIDVKPLQSAHRLIITFAVQTWICEQKNALRYISHMLGDEGSGSLLVWLKKRGWASNLIAGGGIEFSNAKDFNINIQLTKIGTHHVHDILEALFHTLYIIQHDHSAWRRNEKAKIEKLAFERQTLPPTLDDMCELAESGWFPGNPSQEKQPSGKAIFYYSQPHFSACTEDEINHALGWMVPSNLRVKLISSDAVTNQVCEYYNAEYKVTPLPETALDKWQTIQAQGGNIAGITLPAPNPYIVESPVFHQREQTNKLPRQFIKKHGQSHWFSQETTFNSIQGDIFCAFDSRSMTEDLLGHAAKRVWLHAINATLQQKLYQASVAGLNYRLYGHQCGFSVHCNGTTDKLVPLVDRVINFALTDPITEKQFEFSRQNQLHMMQNSLLNKPINTLFSRLSTVIQRHTYSPIQLIEGLEELHFSSFQSLLENGLKQVYCESFMHGNWSMNHAIDWSTRIDKHSEIFHGKMLPRDVLQLPIGETLIYPVACLHDDAAAVLYLQAPSDDIQDTAFCMVVEQLLAGPFFNALRTDKQLGYIVGSGYSPFNQHPGIVFYVQSPHTSTDDLFAAIVSFLREQINAISYYQESWPAIRANILKQLAEKDASLSMQSQRYWLNIGTGDVNNQRQHRLYEAVSNLSFAELLEQGERLLARDTYGELVLVANGKLATSNYGYGRVVQDVNKFKSSSAFFP